MDGEMIALLLFLCLFVFAFDDGGDYTGYESEGQ